MNGYSMEANTPMVSVVLLTVNRFEYLKEAINSLFAQHFTNWELLIIQDGVNDKVTACIQEIMLAENRISFYQRPELNSIGSSINYAIRRAKGKYIAILDDDDVWFNTSKLDSQVTLLESKPHVNLTAGWAYGIDKNGERISEIKKSSDQAFIRKNCLVFNPVIHSSSFYRRQVALEVGLYDETIPDYQDWDFVLKMLRAGQVEIVPEFLIEYRIWGGSSTSNKVKSMAKSTGMIIRKHHKAFPKAAIAFAYYCMFLAYSKIPFRLQKITARYISSLKKSIFSKYS